MYECKVYDGQGNLKKVVSSKETTAMFWKLIDPSQQISGMKGMVGSRRIVGTDHECICVVCGKGFKGKTKDTKACNSICEKKRRKVNQAKRYQDIKTGKVVVKTGLKRKPHKIQRKSKWET